MRTESLVLLCRAGFEKECSAEIIERLATIGVAGYCRAGQGSGWVEVKSAAHWDPLVAFETLRLRDLVFTRDWFAGVPFRDLHPGDRLAPLLTMARAPGPFMPVNVQSRMGPATSANSAGPSHAVNLHRSMETKGLLWMWTALPSALLPHRRNTQSRSATAVKLILMAPP